MPSNDLSRQLATMRPTIQKWIREYSGGTQGGGVTGAAGGITVHNALSGRDVVNSHPISAITGLASALAATSTINSPNSTINVTSSGSSTGVDVDLAHAFNWTAAHDFGSTVDVTGALTADSTATIGGILTANDDITAGGLRWDNGLGALWLNDGAPDGSSTLHVQSTNTTKNTLSLQQTAGQTGDLLAAISSADSDMLRITAGGGIESGTFVSGASGWQIAGPTGNAEFNDLTARGVWSAAVFAIDEWQATNGTHIITPSNASVYEDVLTTGTGDSFTLKVDNSVISPGWWFDVGDTLYTNALGYTADGGAAINARFFYDVQANVGDFTLKPMFLWMTVTARGTVDTDNGYQSYTVDVEHGTDGTIRKASAVVNYGQRTSDDDPGHLVLTASQQYSPYISVRTMGNDTPWSHGFSEHVRIGRLNGVSSTLGSALTAAGDAVWGLAAGTDLSDSSAPHVIVSDAGVGMFRVTTRFSAVEGIVSGVISDTGSFTFAKDVSDTTTGGIRFFSSTGNLTIGDPSGNRLNWYFDTGELSINSGPLATDGNVSNRSPGLILSANHFGHWRGVAQGWGTYFDSGGNMALVSTSEDAIANAGIKYDADQGILSGFNPDGRQWWADGHDGSFYAGGGAVAMNENGLSLDRQVATGPSASLTPPSAITWGSHISIRGFETAAEGENYLFLVAGDGENESRVKIASAFDMSVIPDYGASIELISPYTGGTMDDTTILMVADNIRMGTIPTDPTGLPSGSLWNDLGTVKIV